MQSIFEFVVEPKGGRYNNHSEINGKKLILNTEIYSHLHVNREAIVITPPRVNPRNIKKGDTVIVHHNVFRRWENIRKEEKNSRGYLEEGKYLIEPDQIYMYKSEGKWISSPGFCFVVPIKSNDLLADGEQPLMGVVKHSDGTVEEGSLVGFRPGSEYEFIIDGIRMYRVMSHFITIKYEYEGNEEEYNPSWAQSS